MLVSEILKTKGSTVKTIRPETPMRAVAQALRGEGVGVMVVTDEIGTLKGIISERDLARGMADAGEGVFSLTAAGLMTANVVTCAPEDTIAGISRVMTQRRIRHLPVMTGRKLVGLVSIGDVLKHRLDEMQLEANVLRDVAIAVR